MKNYSKLFRYLKDLVEALGIASTIRLLFWERFYYPIKLKNLDLNQEKILEINNYKICTIPNDKGISAELLVHQIHEPIHTKLLIKELKQGMICLDIGANIGYYALLESKLVGEKGRVIAIEPSPKTFNCLKKNSNLQDTKNLEVYNFAAGDTDGMTKFQVSSHSNWSRIVKNDQSIPQDDIIEEVDMPMNKIDSFLADKELSKLDIIRMDVEGFEFEIFKGMKETVKKFKPLIIIEIHGSFSKEKAKNLLMELKKFGYEAKSYYPRILDIPMVENSKRVKKGTIDELIRLYENNNKILINPIVFFAPKSYN